jgi:hypothetical protein
MSEAGCAAACAGLARRTQRSRCCAAALSHPRTTSDSITALRENISSSADSVDCASGTVAARTGNPLV